MIDRIVTGIQSSGKLHLGNILGAIEPALNLVKTIKHDEALFFIADLHTLTSSKDKEVLIQNVKYTAASWLACGLNPDKCILFRQSRIPQVCELAWYLNCFTPYPMLANAHSFKDKSANLADVNAGLFTYPVLMAADITIYNGTVVPVGKDQLQHIEITRDIVSSFNAKYGDILALPRAFINEKLATIPGIDGRKMSKSYNNTIDIFAPEQDLYKKVMSIQTDSTPLDSPKDYESCNVFNIYKTIAMESQILEIKNKYKNGGYGYGTAKKELFELILQKFEIQRSLFNEYIHDDNYIETILKAGEAKVSKIVTTNMDKIRSILGYL